MLEGIAYLHEKKVAHRDIKPANILISSDKTRVVLVDFNVAKQVKEEGELLYTAGAGTLAFAGPERLTESAKGYTDKIDIWAAGLVLVMLLIGYHPFTESEGSTAALIK